MHEQRKEKSLVHFQKTRSTTDTVALHTRSVMILSHLLHKYSYYKYGHGTSTKHLMEVINGYDFGDQNRSPNPQPHHSGPECLPFEHVSGVALSSTVERCLKMYKDVTDQLHLNTFQTNIFGPLLLDEGWKKNNQWSCVYFFNPGLIFIFISTLLASNPFQSWPWCRCNFSSQTQGFFSKSISTAKWPKYFAAVIFQSKILNSIHTSQPLPPLNSPSAIHKIPLIFSTTSHPFDPKWRLQNLSCQLKLRGCDQSLPQLFGQSLLAIWMEESWLLFWKEWPYFGVHPTIPFPSHPSYVSLKFHYTCVKRRFRGFQK